MPPPTVEQITDPLIGVYRPVPHVSGKNICQICHTASDLGSSQKCHSCRLTSSQVSRPVELMVPVSLHVNDQLYLHLRDYKRSLSASRRAALRIILAATLGRFLTSHRGCVTAAAGEDWDTVAVMPSTTGAGLRDIDHRLAEVVRRAPGVEDPAQLLTSSLTPPHRLDARDNGFVVEAGAAGRRVLIIDDMFTTGSRVQSAGSALSLAGATVIGAVVLGRYVRTDFDETVRKKWWSSVKKTPFSFDTCCLEPPA